LSGELLRTLSCVTEAPHQLRRALGTAEGCPEKSLAALVSSLAESGPAARQTVSAFKFQPSLRYLAENPNHSRNLEVKGTAKPEIKIKRIQNVFEIILPLLLRGGQAQP